MKKIVAILLCGLMVFSTACKKSTRKTTSPAEENEETTKPGSGNAGVITGTLNLDPDAEDAGRWAIVLPVNPGNIQVQNACFDYYFDGEQVVKPFSGAQVEATVSYKAEKDSELVFYILPFSKNLRWNVKEALASQALKAEATEDGELVFKVDLPDNVTGADYAFLLVEDGEAVCYYKTTIMNSRDDNTLDDTVVAKKPVIYLYPEEETEVYVTLDLAGSLICSYPKYLIPGEDDTDVEGWHVMAYPDGMLTNLEDGRNYDYRFWEGNLDMEDVDFGNAACIAGKDTAAFLEEYLSAAGLNDSEIDDFISYWLPQMEGNAYNLITFTCPEYEEAAKLNIFPKPDSELRIFMVFTALDEPVDSAMNMPKPFVREGFTVVEWGGCEI